MELREATERVIREYKENPEFKEAVVSSIKGALREWFHTDIEFRRASKFIADRVFGND